MENTTVNLGLYFKKGTLMMGGKIECEIQAAELGRWAKCMKIWEDLQ